MKPHLVYRLVVTCLATLSMVVATAPTGTAGSSPGEALATRSMAVSPGMQHASNVILVPDSRLRAGSHDVRVVIRDRHGKAISTRAARLTAAQVRKGLSSGRSASGLPMWRVGLGWYIYVYLNAGDINWLRGLGYTAATTALCALLTTTIVGGVACAVAAYVVWTIFYRPTVVPAGYCMEYKFNYSGGFAGAKLVKTKC